MRHRSTAPSDPMASRGRRLAVTGTIGGGTGRSRGRRVVLFPRQSVGQQGRPAQGRQPVSPIRSGPGHGRITGKPRRWLPFAVMLAGLALVTTGCKSTAFTRMGLLPPVTRQGEIILHMWQGSWIAAWSVGIVVWGGILWAVAFHRKRGDQLPQQVRYNLPIEILYTVLPFIMVGVIFYFTARDENYITKVPAHPAVIVDVTGYQWSWQFQYPQYQLNKPGQPKAVVTENGSMWKPAATKQNLPLLVIPENETVQFNLTSID